MMRMAGIVLLALVTAPASPGAVVAAAPANDAALLPANGFETGWNQAGAARVFTSADLYGHINGGAEVFLELGFEQVTVQKYRAGAEELTVELYRMADPTAARAIYLARRGKETRDPGLRERHTASRQQVLLQRHRYVLIVSGSSGTTAKGATLVKAAAATASRLPADEPVKALDLLPRPGLVEGSERLLRGPVGLQSVFTLGDGDVLQLGGRLTAAAADYRDPAGGGHALIVAQYPSAAAAGAAFKYLLGHLDSYLKPTAKTDTRLVFVDYEKKFGVATASGSRIEVRVHLAKPPA